MESERERQRGDVFSGQCHKFSLIICVISLSSRRYTSSGPRPAAASAPGSLGASRDPRDRDGGRRRSARPDSRDPRDTPLERALELSRLDAWPRRRIPRYRLSCEHRRVRPARSGAWGRLGLYARATNGVIRRRGVACAWARVFSEPEPRNVPRVSPPDPCNVLNARRYGVCAVSSDLLQLRCPLLRAMTTRPLQRLPRRPQAAPAREAPVSVEHEWASRGELASCST